MFTAVCLTYRRCTIHIGLTDLPCDFSQAAPPSGIQFPLCKQRREEGRCRWTLNSPPGSLREVGR